MTRTAKPNYRIKGEGFVREHHVPTDEAALSWAQNVLCRAEVVAGDYTLLYLGPNQAEPVYILRRHAERSPILSWKAA